MYTKNRLFSRIFTLIIIWSLSLPISACMALPFGPTLSKVRFQPDAITPNADGKDDVTHIYYRVGRPANVSIYVMDSTGKTYYVREQKRRSPGDYDFLWGATVRVDEPVKTANFDGRVLERVLPNGDYTWVVEAQPDSGQPEKTTGKLQIRDGDTALPEMRNFMVSRTLFTPNQDGIDDRLGINYYLNKAVAEVQVYMQDNQGNKYPIPEVPGKAKPGAAGPHGYDYEGGVDRGADPPPDGEYAVVGEARDRVGNHVVVSRTVTIKEGGLPRADIVNNQVEFSPKVVPLGSTLYFTLTVENNGPVPIRTAGPPPGTRYTSQQNFNTPGFFQQDGAWRVGIDFETNQGQNYPWRFAIGQDSDLEIRTIDGQQVRYLMPGHQAVVTGSIQLLDKVPRNMPYFWAGLIHEGVGIDDFNNHVAETQIDVAAP